MTRDKRKGQSILEYTLLLGAIIGVLAVILLSGDTSVKGNIKTSYEKFGTALQNSADSVTMGVYKE